MISQRSIVTLDELQELTGLSIYEIAIPVLPAKIRRGIREGFFASELKFWWFDFIIGAKLNADFRKRVPDINWSVATDQFFRKLARARRRVNKRKPDAKQ